MSELFGWIIMIGLVCTIVCIFMLSSQLEQHVRQTAALMAQSNEVILARLDRLSNPNLHSPEPTMAVVIETRHAYHSESRLTPGGNTHLTESTDFPPPRVGAPLST